MGESAPGHSRCTHGDDGGDDVQAAEDRGEAEGGHGEHEEDLATVVDDAQRGVGGPAGVEAAQCGGGQQADGHGRDQPEGDGVQAGEGHVVGADHYRYQVVAERPEDCRNCYGDHEDAVHAHDLVVAVGVEDALAGLCKLEPDDHGRHATEQQHNDEGCQILDADYLVVGSRSPDSASSR